MSTWDKMRKRLKLNRPSLRARARPPKHRSAAGSRFSAANLPVALAFQHCTHCGHVQYPPTELCSRCLEDALVYRETAGSGTVLASSALHHSLWEYFKRRVRDRSWPIGSVQLDAGPVVIAHLAEPTLAGGDRVTIFSHSDASQASVLIAVSEYNDVSSGAQRRAVVEGLGLHQPAPRAGGV